MTTFRFGCRPAAAHLPGQHYAAADRGRRLHRVPRTASPRPPDGRPCDIELTVDHLEGGEVSGYLHDAVEVGDPLEVRGPFGGWFVWHGTGRRCWSAAARASYR